MEPDVAQAFFAINARVTALETAVIAGLSVAQKNEAAREALLQEFARSAAVVQATSAKDWGDAQRELLRQFLDEFRDTILKGAPLPPPAS